MLLGKVPPTESEKMICFEREWFYKELVELFTDKKTGKLSIPTF